MAADEDAGPVKRICFITALLLAGGVPSALHAATASQNVDVTVVHNGNSASTDLRVAANGHYIEQSDGTPFFFLSDTEWILNERSDSDVTSILNDRASKGFTVVQVFATRAWSFDGANDVTHDANGNLPFIGNDVTQLNPPYWNRWLSIADQAATKGLHFLLIYGEPVARNDLWKCSSPAQCYEYGRQIGNLFKDKTNIIFCNGYDSHAGSGTDYYRAAAEGVADGVNGVNNFNGFADYSTSMMSFHGYDVRTILQNDSWLDFYGTEVWGCIACLYDEVSATYNQTNPTKPSTILEADYENYPYPDGTATPYRVRFQVWSVFFAGGSGYAYGHNDNYHPERSVSGYLSAGGAQGMQQFSAFMRARSWWNLVPHQAAIVSGAGSGVSRKAAVRSMDGNECLVYYPAVESVTIDMGCITANTVTASWFDPRSGSTQSAGTFTRTQQVAMLPPAGWEDAVLILE